MEQGLAQQRAPHHPAATSVAEAVSPPSSRLDGAAASGLVVAIPVAEPTAATLKLYAGEWSTFVTWCRAQGRPFLPATADTLAAYLLAAAPGLSRGTLGRRRAAIRTMHRQAGLSPPQLDAASRKALRTAAKPAVTDRPDPAPPAASLVRIATRCPRDLAGLRDRALLLLAAAIQRPPRRPRTAASSRPAQPDASMAANRGEIVPRLFLLALEAEDTRFTAAGVVLKLRSRSDEPAPTRTVVLARAATAGVCPVRALEDWLRSSDTTFGPVFRKVDRWGNIEHARLGPDAWRIILARRRGTAHSRARP